MNTAALRGRALCTGLLSRKQGGSLLLTFCHFVMTNRVNSE